MTDKQMIIDDVDVSKCEFYSGGLCNIPDSIETFDSCVDKNPNCYYKQLKRKEQECEELKDELLTTKCMITTQGMENGRLYEQLDQLKAENEELKTMLKDLSYENQKFCYQIEEQTKQLEPFKDEYFKGLDNVVIAELAKKSIRITAENCKLEQTLAEIKEIAELKQKQSVFVGETVFEQILQKISECEVKECIK